jgi:preprotein translocase subunit SecG
MSILVLASFGRVLLTIAFVAVSVLLIGLVLLQKNRGSGLSGAFGGVGGHTAFGTKTGDFLTWVTVSLTALFLLLSIAGTYVFEPEKPAPAPPAPTSPMGSQAMPPMTPGKPTAAMPPKPSSTTPPPVTTPVKVQPMTIPPSNSAPPPSATPTSGPGGH